MLKFMTDHRGMMSIFTLFVLVPVMVIAAVLIDFARLSAIKASASATAETYANSYLSIYDELLNEMYGILAISQDSEEGKKLKEDLENYMKAAYAPNKVDDTHITGTYAHLLVQEILGSENKNALYLTGSALGELGAEEYAMLSDSDYDILQMQVSEYVKFIGPTELVINVGPFAEKLIGSSESKGEVEQTKKNQEIIRKKNEIDNDLGELNAKIGALYQNIRVYDAAYTNLYNALRGYLVSEKNAYANAVDIERQAMEELKLIADKLKKAPANKTEDKKGIQEVINENRDKAKEIFTEKYSDSYPYRPSHIDGAYNENSMPHEGITLNKNKIDSWITQFENCGSGGDTRYCTATAVMDLSSMQLFVAQETIKYCKADLAIARDRVSTSCTDLGQEIRSLQTRINDLISETESANPDDKSFSDGLKKDYSFFVGESGGAEQTQENRDQFEALKDLRDYDFSGFGSWFSGYAAESENKLWEDFYNNGLLKLTSEGSGGLGLDSYLTEQNDAVQAILDIVEYDDAASRHSKIQEILTDEFFPAYENMRYRSDVTNLSLPLADGNMGDYYSPMSSNSSAPSYNVSWNRIYQILSEWHADGESESNEQNEQKKAAEDLADLLKNISLPGENIKLRGGKKRISVGSSGGDDYSGKPNFDDIVTDSNSIPTPESGVDIAMNKLMLMMYDYGMFTCQTSDMEEDPDNSSKINRIQPMSYQGVALAKESDGKYESSNTDFFLYNEMEYIFGGNADSEKNFNKVRNCLAAIRFVPNYISTYSIDEINRMIGFVRDALSWCPLAAVVVCQALRIGLASLETWADLDLLYGGHSVLFTKSKIEDLSLIAAVKAAAAKADASDDMKGLMGNIKNVTGRDLSSVNTSQKSGGLKVNYKQYLLLLELVFVNQYDMIKRTGDLIETNINYVNGSADISSDGDVQVLTLNDSSWRLSKAATAVKASVDVNLDFIFIGNGSDSVFNTSEYEEVSELADKDSVYTMTVKREY